MPGEIIPPPQTEESANHEPVPDLIGEQSSQTTFHSPLEGESQPAEPSGDSGCGGGTNRPTPEEPYINIPGFCRSAPLKEVRKHGHVLTPGRYVGAEPQEDDGEPFEDKMKRLTAELQAQQTESARLDAAIADNLKTLGFWERVE